MKVKEILAAVLATSMVFTLTACGGNEEKPNSSKDNGTESKGTLIVATSSAPIHFNADANAMAGSFPAVNIFSGLLETTISGAIIPDLAKEYTISDDGLTYTFKLNSGVKWHDGKDFSSDDVKFTFDTIIKEKGVNIDKYKNIKEITTPDKDTVIFKLENVDASLISYIPMTDILPKHLYEGTNWLENPANKNPIGTGAFNFVCEEKDVSITLEANKDYFKGEPGVDKIIYKIIPDENTAVQAYLNGEVDLLGLPAAISPAAVPSLQNLKGTKVQTMISADRQYLVTNMAKSPWNDVNVRRAIALCLDRPQFVEKAHKGFAEVAEGFYTPAVSWAYTDKYKMPDRDVEAANKLLDEAGLKKDANGVRIKDAQIVIFEFAVFSDIATILQQNLKDIGIESKITTLEYAAWMDKMKNGDFDFGITGGFHGPDPDNLSGRVGVGGWGNFMKYNNPELEKLLQDGRMESDQTKRAEIYSEVQRIISEDLPIMPMTEWCYIIVSKDNMSGHPIELQDSIGSANYFKIKFN
ncbi:MAG: ABC transporter substrate-binding protein [Oscillospiraceae bacterium]